MKIDELPDDLVEEILSRMPLCDAVRTSVLSKKWRYAWSKLPQLVFDDELYEESIKDRDKKLIYAIHQVLLLHQGPLHEFALSGLSNSCDIDQFILAVLRKGVEKLSVRMKNGEHKPYKLPSSIFVYYHQLTDLKLTRCVFEPPLEFNGFSKLLHLQLRKVRVDGSRLSSLISNSPLLRYLDFSISNYNCGGLEFVAPNLEFLYIHALCESLYFKNTPKLKDLKIYNGHTAYEIEPSGQYMFCGRLPAIEELYVDEFCLKYFTGNRAPSLLLNDLCNLNTLRMYFCFGILDEVVPALCLIKNAKNLEKLDIIMFEQDETELNLLEVEGFSDITLDHLREVELELKPHLKAEMQFIEFILATSPVLEKVIIDPGDTGLRKHLHV